MRAGLLTATFLLFGCVSSRSQHTTGYQSSFRDLKSLELGVATENDVFAKFGTPTRQEERGEQLLWIYDDRETGFHRLTVSFHATKRKMISWLWLPKASESESSLVLARRSFPNARFQSFPFEKENPHAASSVVSLQDKQKGITIIYDSMNDVVEAIGFFDVSQRKPLRSVSDDVKIEI